MKTQTLILLCMMTLSSTSCGKNEEVRIVEELITENGSGSEQEKPTPNDSTSLHAPDKGTMENVNPHDYIADAIDLGLSVKWASFNIGASKPEEYGGLYGWADGTGTKTSAEYLSPKNTVAYMDGQMAQGRKPLQNMTIIPLPILQPTSVEQNMT